MVLGFEEAEAYRRIRVARVIRAFPESATRSPSDSSPPRPWSSSRPWLERKNIGEWLAAAAGQVEARGRGARRRPLSAGAAAGCGRNFPFHPLVMTVGAPPPRAATGTDDALIAAAGAPPRGWKRERSAPGRRSPRSSVWRRAGSGWPPSPRDVRVGFDAACVIASF